MHARKAYLVGVHRLDHPNRRDQRFFGGVFKMANRELTGSTLDLPAEVLANVAVDQIP